MNSAMSEMGGMANKLNAAIQERDKLKREVAYLSQTLTEVNALPSHNVNNMEAKTQIESLQHSVNYYVKQIERLTEELENCKSQNRSREAEMIAELQELTEMNARFKDVNQELNKRLNGEDDRDPTKHSTSVGSYLLPESQDCLQVQSKKMIKEMQATPDSDEKQAEAREQKHQEEMSRMKERVKELEEIIRQSENKQALEIEVKQFVIEIQELKAQLAETDRQLKVVKAEGVEYQEKYYKAERDASKSEAAWNQCQKQLNTQNELNLELKQRNSRLEIELSKVLNQLQSANEKYKMVDIEHRKLENEIKLQQEKIEKLESQIREIKSEHAKELKKIKEQRNKIPAPKTYTSSESKHVSEIQIQLTQAQTDLEKEKTKRLTVEDNLDAVKFDFESIVKKKNELQQELEEAQRKNDSLERKLTLMSGKYEDIQGEKMVEEMSREQLEDVTNVLRVRVMSALDKTHAYAEKYRSLKQKHKAKIRKIRDLFTLERMTTAEEVEKLELRLMIAETALQRELSWKQDAIDRVMHAGEEHRKAIRREDEARKNADDKSLELSLALGKNKDLNEENEKLQTQLAFLERQKQEIESLIVKENQKKELSTLLSSLSLSGSFPRSSMVKPDSTVTASLEGMKLEELGTEDSGFQGQEAGSGEKRAKYSIKRTDL